MPDQQESERCTRTRLFYAFAALALGALAFSLSQIFFRLPVLFFVRSQLDKYILARLLPQTTTLVFCALSAALWENSARVVLYHALRPPVSNLHIALLFGIGHWLAECIWLLLLPSLLITSASGAALIAERFVFLPIQCMFALLIARGYRTHRIGIAWCIAVTAQSCLLYGYRALRMLGRQSGADACLFFFFAVSCVYILICSLRSASSHARQRGPAY